MKQYLLDTSVILDLFLNRVPWAADTAIIWDAHRQGRIEALVAAFAVPTIFYIVRQGGMFNCGGCHALAGPSREQGTSNDTAKACERTATVALFACPARRVAGAGQLSEAPTLITPSPGWNDRSLGTSPGVRILAQPRPPCRFGGPSFSRYSTGIA